MERVVHQNQVGQAARRQPGPAIVQIGPHIAIDSQKRTRLQQGKGAQDTPARLQGWPLGGIADAQPPAGAIPQSHLEAVPQMTVIDDNLHETRRRQTFQMVDDEGLAPRHQQGLGGVVREGTHALAASRGQDHGFHGYRISPLGPRVEARLWLRGGIIPVASLVSPAASWPTPTKNGIGVSTRTLSWP